MPHYYPTPLTMRRPFCDYILPKTTTVYVTGRNTAWTAFCPITTTVSIVTARGKYIRTPEIRGRNRANAVPGKPCPQDCTCFRHIPHGKPCEPNCECGRHFRTEMHNKLIGMGVMKAKQYGKVSALRRPDHQPVACMATKPSQTSFWKMILDNLVPVYSECRSCGLIMQVTDQGEHAHPCCAPKPTRVECWEQSWLEIASSAPYEQLSPCLQNKLDDLEFKIGAEHDHQTLHDAAMQYAQWGWRVFPLAQNNKRPAIHNAHSEKDPLRGKCKGECGKPGHGVLDATSDPDRIHLWWTRNPNLNIGLATGFLFDVIDVDPSHGGAESLAKLLAANRIPMVHGIVATAGFDGNTRDPHRAPGLHLYIKAIGRGNAAGVLPGVDYRGRGGYVVAPPSTLGSRVRSWSWAVEPSPEIKGE